MVTLKIASPRGYDKMNLEHKEHKLDDSEIQ